MGVNKEKSMTAKLGRKVESFADIQDRFMHDYGVTVDDDLGALPEASWRQIADGVDAMEKEFPGASLGVGLHTYYKTKNYAYYRLSENGVSFNERWFGDNAKLSEKYAEDVDHQFHVSGTTAAHISTHEMAHALEAKMVAQKKDRVTGIAVHYKAYGVSKSVVSRATKEAGKKTGKSPQELRKQISRYADAKRNGAQNWHETFAEGITDAIVNGSNAAPLSQEIYAIVKEEYKPTN